MRILVACEESQAVTKELRALGHQAYSCDLLPCSGGHPEWHYNQDVFEVIDKGWDMMIAHPPCTYLSVSGARWMYNKDGTRNQDRWQKQQDALSFVQRLMDAPIDKIAIENPVSVISSQIRKPDQIVQPWMFGDAATKTTCLWLKNLPPLLPTEIVDKGEFVTFSSGKRMSKWYNDARKGRHGHKRSKTFQGIAKAMATQWTNSI
jgi:hypothetical protein